MITRWHKAREALATLKDEGTRPMRDSASFWNEFRRRAPSAQVAASAPPRVVPSWGLALAAAACLMLVVAGGMLLRGPQDAPYKLLSPVSSVKVFAAHTAVFVMTDLERGASIVWVSGMEERS